MISNPVIESKTMKNLIRSLRSMAPIAVVAALSMQSQPVRAAESQVVHGHVLKVLGSLKPLHHYDGTNRLQLAIGLPWRDQAGLSNLLTQLYDPKSPNYHHYLSAKEFADRFGPAQEDYQAVISFAASHHLKLKGTHSNRVIVDVEGSVSDIENAFHTSLQVYSHPTEHREFYAPSTEPSVDAGLPVLHIAGLDNYTQPRPMIVRRDAAAGPAGPAPGGNTPGLGSGPSGSYLGYDFRDAYAPGVTMTGTGQSVGLLEFYSGFVQSDVTAYETLAGLPNIPVIPVLLDGYNGAQGIANDEVSLDIDMAMAMAPGLTSILVYEGEITDDILSRMATDNSCKQLSASWTYPIDPTSDQLFQEFGAQGQSFFNASGDDDAYVGGIPTPADDPYVTVVGGTTLSTSGPLGAWTGEKVWNLYSPNPNGGDWGSSGGISTVYAIPSWQKPVSMTSNKGSTIYRNLPDVAMTADNIWVYFGGGFGGIFGGTSAATPLWAGFCALVNQQALQNGENTMGFINPAIYAIGLSNIYNSCFHDTTNGDNTWSGSPNLFYAVPGYDLCTGWGTPAGTNLVNALAPATTIPVLRVLTNIVSGGNGNGRIDFDECNNLTIVLTNVGGGIATGISATIYSATSNAIVATGSATYPSILPHGAASNLTYFTLSTEPSFVCGTPVNLTMVLKSDQGITTNIINIPSGILGTPYVVSNETAVIIPTDFVPVSSPVVVSNLQSVGKLTVSVYMTAQYDEGMTLSLVNPGGTQITLSANNGGFGQNYGLSCAQGFSTVFDDAAATPVTSGTAPFYGSFQPQQALSNFNLMTGTNLNGVWNLVVSDEFPGDTAQLNCWSLNIYPEVCQDGGGECPGADLSLAMSAAPSPVFVNSNLVYTLTVSNAGPGAALNTVIVETLPPGAGFVTTSNYPVSVSKFQSNNVTTLNMLVGSLEVYQSATIAVVVTNTIPGLATSQATVGSQDPDPNPVNNSASASALVTEPTADVAVTMTGTPSSVLQDGLLTYNINVTNNGPFTANNVLLTTTLPATANFVSAGTTLGTISFNGTSANIGNLGMGTNVTVTIVVSPTLSGNIVARTVATISSNELDPVSYNNSASIVTTVGPAADLSVTAYAVPNPVVAGSNFSCIATVSNAGPATATSIAFSQTIPSGVTNPPVSSSLAGYSVVNGSIIGTIPSLAPGASVIVTDIFTSPTILTGGQTILMSSAISATGQPGDPNTNNNFTTLSILDEPPTIKIVPAGAQILSGSSNGAIGPTGTYQVAFYLVNQGNVSTTNLVATLQSGHGLIFPSGGQSYGSLSNVAVEEPFTFTANSTNGGTIQAILQLQDGANNLGYVTNIFYMPTTVSFGSTNYISIPIATNIPEPDSGAANPYPSTITVSNVAGDVSDVSVTLSNFYHSYPNDVGVMLIGPKGQNCVLMAAAAAYSTMQSPVTLTFDQNGSMAVPSQGPLATATYVPADYNLSYSFSNSPVTNGPFNTNLANFESLSPNGTWSLYVYDEVNGDAGYISNGWSLNFTTVTPVSPLADLAVTMSASTSAVTLQNTNMPVYITNTFTVTNIGPNTAFVYVTNVLTSGLQFYTNLYAYGITNAISGQTNVFSIGNVASGAGAIITNVVQAVAPGAQTNSIYAWSSLLDPNLANNSASATIAVSPTIANLVILPPTITPSPVLVGATNLTITLYVSNAGPSYATNVAAVFAHPTNIVVNVNQGGVGTIPSSTLASNYFGTINSGSVGVAQLTCTAATAGSFLSVWTIATSSSNTDQVNTTNVVLTVATPAPVITNGPATLLSGTSGSLVAGATNQILFDLINVGTASTSNLVATLQTSGSITPVGIASKTYGPINVGASSAQAFSFIAAGLPGQTVVALLSLSDGSNNLGTLAYTFFLPESVSITPNNGTISIPFVGPATPYPSSILVSGLSSGGNDLLLTGTTVTLNGFTHSFPHDVEAVLVDPAGQEVMLMEHTGGPCSVANLTLSFSDSASQFLPLNNSTNINAVCSTPLATGTFLTTAYAPFDTLPGLAPVPTNSTNLSYFNGTDPNGIWSLYVYDDSAGNSGQIANGWTLALSVADPVNPISRLVVSTLETPNPIIGGNYADYQITVYNMGPDVASNVVLTDTISPGASLSLANIAVSQGGASVSGQSATCTLGTIASGSNAIVTIQALAPTNGIVTNTAVAVSSSTDLYPPDATSVNATPVGTDAAAFLTATTMANGVVQLAVDGYAGQNYAIQMSTNLTKWSTVTTNSGSFMFFDNTSNASRCFYRAIKLPK